MNIAQLEPKAIWKNFSLINAIPRASKKEDKIVQFMLDFGNKLGLETQTDATGNVLIRKPATPGMENRKTVVLQSHLDMVHQKNNSTEFDFDRQGIDMYIDGDWVKAKGTTLGADNGLGVAAIMGILESEEIEHPAIEALFTIDEETGMTGAKGLKGGFLKGDILLNLDTEEDDEIDIGCAGGIDVTATKSIIKVKANPEAITFELTLGGLQGGHSGMDIHKGLGNANKIMNDALLSVENLIQLSTLKGGSLRNAIPRESVAVFTCNRNDEKNVISSLERSITKMKTQYLKLDPQFNYTLKKVNSVENVLSKNDQNQLFSSIQDAHNGVFKMSDFMDDLVEASNNIAKITVDDKMITVECLTRSSVEESKMEVANGLKTTFENRGFQVKFSGDYPGWSPNPTSPILSVLEKLYEEIFEKKPKVVACHAGLECGILGSHYPDLDMISFGPAIRGAHSPDEKASISSSQKFWKYLLSILKNTPNR